MAPKQTAPETHGPSIDVVSDIAALRDTWRAFQRHALGGPHDTWEWNEAWMRTVGQSRRPLIVTGKGPDGDFLFLLPLTITRRSGCAVLEWLSADQGNYASGLFHASAWNNPALPRGEALMRHILSALPRVDAVHLRNQPTAFGTKINPLAGLPGTAAASPGHAFVLNANWQAHYAERFSSRMRSESRRGERRLAEQGTLSFNRIESVAGRRDALNRMIRDKRWWFETRGIHDFFSEHGMRDFYRGLMRARHDGGAACLEVFELALDGEAIAANLGIVHRNTFYGLVSSTTSGPLLRHSPGNILLLRVVEHLAQEGITRFDCGAGEDEHKRRWCTEERARRHAIVPVTAKGHVYAAGLKAALAAKRGIKQSPRLWALVQTVRGWKAVVRSILSGYAKPESRSAASLQT